tara:strand:- start:2025 stop:2492 length:468 start_codon:yes stop_codon:yes gene_type:complete
MGCYVKIGDYFDKDKLLIIFDQYKDKVKKYRAKDINGNIVAERDYYELYFSYEDGKDLFDTPPCRGYQYVWMPPRYEMVIHKDLSAIKSRIGSLLEGSGDIIFYDEEDNIIDKYNYEEDILTDVQVRHNVINSDEWRLTFFANFEEPVDVIKVQL